jgi:hypothetical protein
MGDKVIMDNGRPPPSHSVTEAMTSPPLAYQNQSKSSVVKYTQKLAV